MGDDRFDLLYDPGRLSPERILEAIRAIRGVTYVPSIVERPATQGETAAGRIALTALPSDLQAMFAEARRMGKPVLLDFTGPG